MGKIPKKNVRLSASMLAEKKKLVLDDVSAEHACEILRRLAREDAKISKRIEELALECLVKVNPEDIAGSVFRDLDGLEVEDVWDNSGGTRDGYVDPGELASEMFENALEPYLDELRKCQKLSMDGEAMLHCMGILMGLYKFEKEATTEFQDWAVDEPHEYFVQVLDEWMNGNKDPEKWGEMRDFVKRNFPEWYKDVPTKTLGEGNNAAT